MDFKVLETITDVDSAESVRGKSVEELVAWPSEGTNHDGFTAFIELERPGAAWLIFGGRFEELLVEWSSWQVKICTLGSILYITEVKIVLKAHTILATESSEGFVSTNLMLRGHFESTDWADLAVIFDGMDNGGEAVELSQRSSGHLNFFFRRIITVFSGLCLAIFL